MTGGDEGKGQAPESNAHLEEATARANKIFAELGQAVEAAVAKGATQLNVVDIARRAGLEIDERILEELRIDQIIFPHPWLPWHHWWPWRPLWCWWWRRHYPYYRCCPYWWHRCHWW